MFDLLALALLTVFCGGLDVDAPQGSSTARFAPGEAGRAVVAARSNAARLRVERIETALFLTLRADDDDVERVPRAPQRRKSAESADRGDLRKLALHGLPSSERAGLPFPPPSFRRAVAADAPFRRVDPSAVGVRLTC